MSNGIQLGYDGSTFYGERVAELGRVAELERVAALDGALGRALIKRLRGLVCKFIFLSGGGITSSHPWG